MKKKQITNGEIDFIMNILLSTLRGTRMPFKEVIIMANPDGQITYTVDMPDEIEIVDERAPITPPKKEKKLIVAPHELGQ